MHPILFEIAGLKFKTYTLFAILGSLGSFFVLRHELVRRRWAISNPTRWSLFTIIKSTLIGFAGAHALYMITRFDLPLDEWFHKLISFGHGNVWYGGLIAVGLYCLRLVRINKIPLWQFLDVTAMIGCVALGLGRFGCFFNGCCYGIPTALPWGITLQTREGYPQALHPTPLYEMLFMAALFSFLWIRRTRTKFDGELVYIYFLGASIGRFLLEFLRGDTIRGFVVLGLSTSQVLSIIMFFVALAIGRFRHKTQSTL